MFHLNNLSEIFLKHNIVRNPSQTQYSCELMRKKSILNLTATHQVLDWNLVDENSCDECMKIHRVWRNCGYGEQPGEKDKKSQVLNHF